MVESIATRLAPTTRQGKGPLGAQRPRTATSTPAAAAHGDSVSLDGALRFIHHVPLDPARKREMLREAADPVHDPEVWTPGTPIAQGRNAHRTNTPDEMDAAIAGDFNYFEGDFRLEGALRHIPILDHWREPIAAHDTFDVHGLSTAEWLTVGETTRRGLKFDIKQSAAIPKILDEVRRHPSIPQERLMFNADVVRGPGGPSRLKLGIGNLFQDLTASVKDMQNIRRAYPNSCISLGAYTGATPPGTTYTTDQMDVLIEYAKAIGGPGPIQFALRDELVDPQVVSYLKPHGLIGIWNDPSTFVPKDVPREVQRLRAMGVDGMIDLRTR